MPAGQIERAFSRSADARVQISSSAPTLPDPQRQPVSSIDNSSISAIAPTTLPSPSRRRIVHVNKISERFKVTKWVVTDAT
eukprot:IDg15019t1